MLRNKVLEDTVLKFKKRRKSLHGFGYSAGSGQEREIHYIDLSKGQLHNAYSVTKTITALSVGIALSEKNLTVESDLASVFKSFDLHNSDQGDIKIKDLLLMTSGYDWNEKDRFGVGLEKGLVVEGVTFLESVVKRALKHEPGKVFNYDSMNSHILSGVVKELTGQTLQCFARDRIFEPLQMGAVLWDADPEDLAFGGYGLYLSLEDLLILGEAINDPYRMIEWVGIDFYEGMKKGVNKVPYGRYTYGYHTWIGHLNDRSYFAAFGHGGQRIICLSSGEVLVSFAKVWPEFGPMDTFFEAWLEGSN